MVKIFSISNNYQGNYNGKHILTYGSLGEHQAEVMIQEQVENQEEKNQQAEKAGEKPAEILNLFHITKF